MITDDITKDKLERFASSVPSIPEVILRVKEISENPQSSAADLANIILGDHNLTTRILKLANSAYYGEFSGCVATVTQAIILMGFRTVRNVVMSIAIHDTFTNSEQFKGFNFSRFWTKSLGCGVIGKSLANACRYKVPEEAFITGFMHDIGKVVMSQIFKSEYPRIERLIAAGEDEIKVERRLIGTDHCEIGTWLGKRWNLPQPLVVPITHHHRVGLTAGTKSKSRLVDIAYMSHRLFSEVSSGNEELAGQAKLLAEARKLLGTEPEQIVEIATQAWDMIRDISIDLGIKVEIPESSYETSADTEPHTEASSKATPTASSYPEMMIEMQEMSDRLLAREQQLAILQETAESIRVAVSVDEILQTVLESAFRGLGMGRAILLDIDAEQAKAAGRFGFGVESQECVHRMIIEIPGPQGVIRSAYANKRIHNIHDSTLQAYTKLVDPAELEIIEARAFAILPVEINGEVSMVILVNNRNADDAIDDEQIKSLKSLLSQAETAIEKLLLKAKLNEAKSEEVNSLLDTAFS